MPELPPLRFAVLLLSLLLVIAPAQIPYQHTPFLQDYRTTESLFRCSDTLVRGRISLVTGGAIGVYSGMYTALSIAWYGGQNRVPFHVFNDLHEWQQLDKVGHMYGAYQGGRGMIQLLKWSGMKKVPASIIGGATGFLMQAPIEVLDGYAPDYGASFSDIGANFLGGALATVNELAWEEQVLKLKMSAHYTYYALQRPELLGSGIDRLLKDYNGQTYWLSFRVHRLLSENMKNWYPQWLNLAVGYGGEGMIGGYGKDPQDVIQMREYRQWYLSPDIDFSMIRTKSGFLDTVFGILNIVKFPLPAVEFSQKGMRGHWLYF